MKQRVNTFMAVEKKIKKYRFWDKAEDSFTLFGIYGGLIGFALLVIVFVTAVVMKRNEIMDNILAWTMIVYILIISSDLIFIKIAYEILNKKEAMAYVKWMRLNDKGYQYLHWIIDLGNPRFIKASYFKFDKEKNCTIETVKFDFEDECYQRDYTSEQKYEALINNGMWQAVHRMAMDAIEDKIIDERIAKEKQDDEKIEKSLDSYWEVLK